MIHKQLANVEWLEFELLAGLPIIHGCFKRHGGVSTGVLSSLNLGTNTGDQSKNVNQNLKIVQQTLSLEKIILAKLSHGCTVTALTSSDVNIPISDALTTSVRNFAIAVTQADCQAAIFYDPVKHAMANVHCGWRGSVLDIYGATLRSMQTSYGSNPADILVCISPSLGPEHAELTNYMTELPECLWRFKLKQHYFDFWAISRWQLERSGILSQHIQIAEIDTYAHPDYFSYRYSTHLQLTQCGRQVTVCSLL